MKEVVAGLVMMLQMQEGPIQPRILAIDGRCGAGKTTLAHWIQENTGCNVVSVDDFYLPLAQRTPERMAQPGGHIHWERLLSEVIHPLRRERAAVYRPYDCHTDRFLEEITLAPMFATLVEGAYSCLPELWPLYDIRIFLTIDPEHQLQRIEARSGKEGLAAFREIWIPREEDYFQTYQIPAHCEYCFTMDQIKTA